MLSDRHSVLDFDALRDTPPSDDPFRHVVVPNFVRPERQDDLLREFPYAERGGSIPLPFFNGARPIFMELVRELRDPDFRALVEEKLGVSLPPGSMEFTTRSKTRPGDGFIHPDSDSKIVSGLIYTEREWPHDSKGALRLLTSATDKSAFTREIPPRDGTLLLFRRADNSWHGYEDVDAPTTRRIIQFNWFVPDLVRDLVRNIRLNLKRLPFGE